MRALLMSLCVGLAAPAGAVDFHVASDTIGQGYQLITSDGDVLKRSRINQFLGLNIYDMLGDGTNSIMFVSQLRFDSDFGITNVETANIPQLKNNNLSILYGYLELKGLIPYVDLRLGRQLLIDDMDYTMMDGVSIIVHTGAYFALEVVAGSEVKNGGFLDVINDTQLEVDGDGGYDDAVDEELGIVLGASIFLEGLRDHHAKIGYRRIMTPPILAENLYTETTNANGDLVRTRTEESYVDYERVYANYHVRVIPELHLSAAASYDLVTGQVADVRASVRAPRLGEVVDIEASYWHLTPTFEGSSIFNVFSTEPLNDVDLRVRYHFAEGMSAYVGSYVRLFDNETDANDAPAVADGVTDVGVRAGARLQRRRWHAGLDASHQFGYGDLTIIDAFGGYGFLDDDLRLDGRLTTLIYDDELIERLEGVSFGVQVGLSYRVEQMARFHLVSELNTNEIQPVQYRLYGLVDLDFWL